ncbi:hypothetical protein GQ53DRAFT_461259 [Thozetella sp. PMI_491]|nr:hypothetical protein GQ53DRAFT_461259 [Thozetella sp. PMI_491]
MKMERGSVLVVLAAIGVWAESKRAGSVGKVRSRANTIQTTACATNPSVQGPKIYWLEAACVNHVRSLARASRQAGHSGSIRAEMHRKGGRAEGQALSVSATIVAPIGCRGCCSFPAVLILTHPS